MVWLALGIFALMVTKGGDTTTTTMVKGTW